MHKTLSIEPLSLGILRYKLFTMKKFEEAFLKCIREKEITSVRAGKDRTEFTGIWMVEVEGRVFARSYYLRERSWYTSLLEGHPGSIKCGSAIVDVRGEKPNDAKTITAAINQAYEEKYSVKEHNKKWVTGLIQPERVARTMEFMPI